MFKGTKPAGQPRTLRTIAEAHSAPSSYPTDLPYDAQAGAPVSQGGGQDYRDAAEAARPPASEAVRRPTSREPKPIR